MKTLRKGVMRLKLIGLGLLIAGGLLLGGYGIYQLLDAPDLPPAVLWGLLALMAGFVLLVLSLVQERIKDRKEEVNDDYNKH